MSGLSVAGIASGIDSDSIISQMVSFETRSNAQLQARIALEESERLLFQDISSRLQELKGATSAFSSQGLFSSLSTTSSQPDLLSVSASDKAPRGTQRVRVMQLATSHRIGGTGVEDPSATPLLKAGFDKTTYTAQAFSGITSGDRTLETTSNTDPLDNYDYEANLSVDGTYTGTDNLDIQVKIINDATIDGSGNGSVDVKVSLDGGNSFSATATVAVTGGSFSLSDIADASFDNFDATGFDMTFDNLTSKTLKKNDVMGFRARGTSVLEFSVGEGERKSIEIGSDMTLSELVRTINDDSSLGLRADILNDGSATDPYRLILTSDTEGRAGNISVLHNDSVIGLDGVNVENAVLDSLTYGGEISFDKADYLGGLENNSVVIEMMEAGAVGTATFRISTDGGLNFHDNNGNGFTLSATTDLAALQDDNGDNIFASGTFNGDVFDVDFTNSGTFTVGDRVSVDFFDSEIETAQDALINVNGINLVKSSNVVDDVFEGLTLTLKDADPTKTINVGVTEKAGDITSALGGFVNAYNSVMSVLHAQSKFNPEEDDNAPLLMGDSTVRQLQSSIQRYVTGRIGILGSDTMSSLADLGVTTDSKTGQLNFNPTKLTTALNEDPTAVRRLLSRFGDVVEGNNVDFVSSTAQTKAGMYKVEVTQARTRAAVVAGSNATTITAAEELIIRVNKDATGSGDVTSMVVNLDVGMTAAAQAQAIQDMLDSRDLNVSAALENGKIVVRHNEYGADFKIDVVSDKATGESGFTTTRLEHQGTNLVGKINGVEATTSGDLLIGKSGFAFAGLSLRIDNDFSGDAGTIRVNDGLGSSFTKLLDSFIGGEGILDTRINSFDSAISRLQGQISRVNERASLLETRLRKQFTNLEVTLGRLNATGDYLTAQLKALPGVKKD